jgi:hypothetical protein
MEKTFSSMYFKDVESTFKSPKFIQKLCLAK